MRKITVILQNAPDCELDRTVLDVPDSEDPDEAANLAIHQAIAGWCLSVGDTIKISDGRA
jgi:hypothetical protein